ncbi:glutathione S-transferase L3 [Trifolium repens]|nr:glutathione S-transferase L3 [Trifolium repens]
MALGYLMRGREESGIVAPKWYDYEDLVGYVSIVAEELVEPPKIPRLVRSQAILREDGGHSGGRRVLGYKRFFESTELNTPGVEEVAVNLVGATKHPMVVGYKIFMRAEGIPRDEGEKIQDGESNTVVDWITIDLKARWRIVGYALKSRLHENSENQKTEETSSTVAPGARRPPEMAVASVDWRGAQGIWRQAPARSQIVQFRNKISICWKQGLQDKIELVPIDLQDRPSCYKEKVYPANKVPPLEHNNEVRGESLDLIKYIDTHFEGPSLFPTEPDDKEFAEELLSYTNTFNKTAVSSFKGGDVTEVC